MKNRTPLTNMMSALNVTTRYLSAICWGSDNIFTQTWFSCFQMVFPFRLTTLGPCMALAVCTSSQVTGQFGT